MRIQMANFHNISSLTYDIEDNKINFLYGVSGSGKSSIVKAIAQGTIEESDIMVGCNQHDATPVLINGATGPLASTVVFNEDRQTILFSRGPEKGIYDIFIGDEEKIDKLRTKYQDAITALQAEVGNLRSIKGTINDLIKIVGKANKGDKFTTSSRIEKAHKAYSEASAPVRGHIERRGMDTAMWLHKGFSVDDSYHEGICPFCGRRIEGSPNENILAELCELTIKNLSPIFESPELLAQLNQEPLDVSSAEGLDRAKKLIVELPKVGEEIDRIINCCNAGGDYGDIKAMSAGIPSPSPELLSFIPELHGVMAEINNRAGEVRGLLIEMKQTFDNLVRTKCDGLNSKLQKFGIPYFFKISTANRDEKTASYQLVHNKGDKSTDMRDSLSSGERNLITLILFLQDSESKVMLIDDPASSYDDYRRTQIFKAITEVQGKTLLVVSHDQAFVRRAVRKRKDKLTCIGKVDMLCNRSGTASIEPITAESFGYFEDMIRNRIASSLTYYQRMLNIRLLCELHDKASEDESLWGYTSAIMHRKSKAEVLELVKQKGESENAILKRLRDFIGSESASQIDPMPDSIDLSTDGFSEFERLIAKREDIRCGDHLELPQGITKALARDLLNDLVHMNDAMADCIDPYRYPAWSPILFGLL